MKTICEQVILPNVGYRQEDEELFEDNPEEWIRRDLEGSDQGLGRRLIVFYLQVKLLFFRIFVLIPETKKCSIYSDSW